MPRCRMRPCLLMLIALATGAACLDSAIQEELAGGAPAPAQLPSAPAPAPAPGSAPAPAVVSDIPSQAGGNGSAATALATPTADVVSAAPAIDASASLAAVEAAASGASGRVASLLAPGQTLRLFPNDFEDSSKTCTDAEVLRASFPSFSLPADGRQLSLLALFSPLDCSSGQQGALLGFGGAPGSPAVDLAVDCSAQQLVLTVAGSGGARYPLPNANGTLALLLSLDSRQASFSVCANGAQLAPAPADASASAALQQLSAASPTGLIGPAVVFGARLDTDVAARADLAAAFVADYAIPCASTAPGQPLQALLAELAAAGAGPAGSAPSAAATAEVTVDQQPGGDGVVGQPLTFTCTAAPGLAADALRLRVTFFGLTPPGCTASECGDHAVQSASPGQPGQPASLDASVSYPKAGRYIVRCEATSSRGWVATTDHALLVRKQGDPGTADGGAPCCRHGLGVVALQLGRPISDTQYRSGTAAAQAVALGWSEEYLQNEEREAERLFDYGVLAPPVTPFPLALLTCAQTRLAGAGSPALFGITDALAAHSRGHNKRLALLPAGFSWATSTSQIDCQSHWSGWQNGSPFQLPDGRGGACSAACTQAGTQQLLRETGAFEQYNQALIAASYGQLSLSADVAVLPEVLIPFSTGAPDNFSYYEQAPLQAMRAAGEDPWMWMVLAPLAQHRVPPFRAWSGGRSAGGAVFTQCFPTEYYSVHETGHRLGFRHANLYRLNEGGVVAPTNPLGPGSTTTSGYSDKTDIMACCRGDYGLFNRLSAGWLGRAPAERAVLGASDLAAPARHTFSLWPFDRPESRGNLMALTVRRGPDEVLVIGFRSAPHWQDVSITGGDVAPAESRLNVRGLSVEVVRRDPATGKWADHRGLLDFNLLTGDWPDALPASSGDFPRDSSFALLKEGSAWYDPGSGMLLSYEALGACQGTPGLPLFNHSAMNFNGFRGEWPGQELPGSERADFTGFQGLECAQLVITTAAPAPQGRLEFTVEAAPALTPTSSSPVTAASRRRLHMQPSGTPAGQITAGGSWDGTSAGSAAGSGSCGAPLAPTLRLRLPAGQQLSSVIWRDSLNRTVLVLAGASLAAAASSAGSASWTTLPVALPPLYPFQESASDPASSCSAGRAACQRQQRQYSVALLSPDGRYSRAFIAASPPTMSGLQLSITQVFYEAGQITRQQSSLAVLPAWQAGGSGDSPSGIAIYDSAGGQALPLQSSTAALVQGSSLPASSCSRQWSLTQQLSLTGAAIAAAAGQEQVLFSVDSSFPAVSLGPSLLGTAASQSSVALWVRWGPYRRRVALPAPLASLRGPQLGLLHLALVRDGGRLGLWANQQWGGWVLPNLACIPSRPNITYCDRAPDAAGSSRSSSAGSSAFSPPSQIAFGAAAATAVAGGAAADAGLVWARFYSYALPEGDLAAEAGADSLRLAQYFLVQPADASGRGGGKALLVAPPPSGTAGGKKSGGVPIGLLAAAAGGGAALVAAVTLGTWCWCRRRRRQREAAWGGLSSVSVSSAGSLKADAVAVC